MFAGCRRAANGVGAVVSCLAVAGLIAASGASAGTTWLCRPGLAPDPCTPGFSTTVFSPAGARLRVTAPKAVGNPKVDCFYVYPTVSDQPTTQATLHIDPEERSIALYQAARYSQYCRVYAPMYRELTFAAITGATPPPPAAAASAYSDVLGAWRDYLAHYNRGRGVVLIGHSQGAGMLIQLIRRQIDPKPAVRKRLVSAIILGGNVLVQRGKRLGGDFQHVPACQSATELGCVIAWSTFDQPPPSDTLFGISTSPLGGLFGGPSGPGYQALCTNPATLDGTHGLLDPIVPSAPFAPGTDIAAAIALLKVPIPSATTTWVEQPGSYTATCSTTGAATVLQISARDGAPIPTPSPTPQWGLHLLDAQVALGNLVDIVRREADAYAARR